MPITIKSSPLKYKVLGQDEYVDINAISQNANSIPALPLEAGSYVLKCVVTNDTPVLTWVLENT